MTPDEAERRQTIDRMKREASAKRRTKINAGAGLVVQSIDTGAKSFKNADSAIKKSYKGSGKAFKKKVSSFVKAQEGRVKW